MRKQHYIDEAMSTLGSMMAYGLERKSVTKFEFDGSGDCLNPVRFAYDAAPEVDRSGVRVTDGLKGEIPLFTDAKVRCRRCDNCRVHKKRIWTRRAIVECRKSQRSWFCTFTLTPHQAFTYKELARQRCARRAVNFDELAKEDQFANWCLSIGAEFQRTLKRIRKKFGVTLRYFTVFEAHKSGTPHIHCIIHECVGSHELRKRELQAEWHLGFSNVKLIDLQDMRQVYYICKYIGKDMSTRIRASLHYGEEILLQEPTSAKELNGLSHNETK